MTRSRHRIPVQAVHGTTNGAIIEQYTWYKEVITESSFPGTCSVTHIKSEPTNVVWPTAYWRNYPAWVQDVPPPDRLNWGKIPSSSAFGLIQFFAELDQTILLFTKKFWTQLTYGSFTWGVLPFVSEVKALLKTVENLTKRLDSFSYEDQYVRTLRISEPFSSSAWTRDLELIIKYRMTGKADISFQHPGSIMLDRLGFHPDLATAWDLVPLSFVVDWLLPIGDYLESLRGGGWVKTAYFNGWVTAKVQCTGIIRSNQAGCNTPNNYKQFVRYPSSMPIFVPQAPADLFKGSDDIKLPTLQMPTLRQLFNMVYLAGLGKKLNF